MSDKGEQIIYTAAGIEEIQVQGGAVEAEPHRYLDVLAPGDRQVVDRAYARAKEIF